MFFCCYSGKDPLECRIVNDNDLSDELTDKEITTFKVCPQLFFTQFTKFIYFKHFLSFKKNYYERNSNLKKTNKQQRIQKEIEILKSIHMEHIAGDKNNFIF
jgi:ABC-type arginine transport system ATPase subunit